MQGQGQSQVKERGRGKVKSRQPKHNLNRNYNLMGFGTIEINLVDLKIALFSKEENMLRIFQTENSKY